MKSRKGISERFRLVSCLVQRQKKRHTTDHYTICPSLNEKRMPLKGKS